MIETTSGAGLDSGPFDATVFLFGSHTGVFTEHSMEKIVRPLMNGPHRSWILATTAGLPSYLVAIEKRIPAVAQSIAGHKQLGDLDAWLRHGAALWKDDAPLPNIIVSPLLVLTQVAQYWRYLELQVAQTGEAAAVPAEAILPFRDWIKRVRTSPLVPETENPTARNGMADFLEKNFERMSCGGLVLDTQRAREHSVTIAAEGPVSEEVVGRYVEAWKRMGFLN